MFKSMKKGMAMLTLGLTFTAMYSFTVNKHDKETLVKDKSSSEAIIKFDMEFQSDDPQMKQQLFMMDNSKMVMAFKGQKFYSETKIGAIQNSTTIIDKDADKMVILMSGMMGKKATQKEGLENEEEGNSSEVEFEKTDETKEILGYECFKIVGEDEEGNTSIYWVTEEITPEVQTKNFGSDKFKGMPLEFEIIQAQMTMKFTATEVSTEISKKDEKKYFTTEIPEGYDEMPYDEYIKMSGGGL